MTERERIERLMHSANNCRQMLHAIDSKLAEALRCIEDGRLEDCKVLLDSLAKALPEAIATLRHEDYEEPAMASDNDPGQAPSEQEQRRG